MHRVLIIDDDETVRNVLQTFLSNNGFEVTLAHDGSSGLELIKEGRFDLILTDLVMPGLGGIEILKEISSFHITAPILMITAFGTVQSAVDAMKLGAFDYVTKPFNLEEILIVINKALNVSKLQQENAMLKMQLMKKYRFKGLVGDSPRMQVVYELIEKIADTDSTVLILGESGTGKELIAKTLHYNSSRGPGPFVPLNCGAIPRELLESELFGHEKGAFTGAVTTRIGRFELAHNGTLFLDEVAELDPALQVKLLRVLQEREFERVGGMKTVKVDVRILAATNKDLEKATREGKFREDLFYRLSVIPLRLPPLRERFEDIPLLVDHITREFAQKRKREPFVFSKDAMNHLMAYPWPGNVRELENLIERLTILVTHKTVTAADLPERFRQAMPAEPEEQHAGQPIPAATGNGSDLSEDGMDLNLAVMDMEKDLIRKALDKADGVKSKAAQLLGLNRTTLLEKMKKMGIESKKE
jgi:nitrogen regulation protein NR(I)